MKRILAVLTAMAVCVGTVNSQGMKIDPARLVGKWKLVKSTAENAPKDAIVELTKDNKVVVLATQDGQKFEIRGTYRVNADKLFVTLMPPKGGKEEEDGDTIKMLTDDKMVLVDKKGKETELSRIK